MRQKYSMATAAGGKTASVLKAGAGRKPVERPVDTPGHILRAAESLKAGQSRVRTKDKGLDEKMWEKISGLGKNPTRFKLGGTQEAIT